MLGHPGTGGSRWGLCIRDGGGALVFHDEIPAGGACAGRPCWRTVGHRGVAYKNARAQAAVTSLHVTAEGRTGSQVTATIRGPGALQASPATPVTVQLEIEGGACWTSVVDAGGLADRGARRTSP